MAKKTGGYGNDYLYGGAGNDILKDSWGNDHLYGGDGNDILKDSWGDDHLYGGDGNDILKDSWGDDVLYGGAGTDRLTNSWGDDHLYGGDGNDILKDSWGDDVLYGGAGNDQLYGGRGNDVFVVNPDDTGKDTVTDFTRGRDKIQITTATRAETTLAELLENTGITITGNTIFNADGDAIMVLRGFAGELTYSDFHVVGTTTLGLTRHGTSRSEYSSSRSGDIGGGWGDDTLFGYGGGDHIDGSWGNDVIYGGDGGDHFTGGHGDDTLYGYDGEDHLKGGWGDDILDGGDGNNYLTGGRGNDIFVLSQGRDTVMDFKQGEDKIGIREGTNFNFETDVNGKTISNGDGTMKLRGLTGELTRDDFVVFDGSVVIPTPETVPTTITLNSDASKIAEADNVVETALTEVILAGGDTTGYTFTTNDARFAVDNGVLSIVAGSDFDYEAGATIEVTVTASKTDSDTLEATYTLTLIDAIEGTESHDTIYGTDGNDIIYGYDGQDHVSSGAGNDRIYGGDGNDVIFAGVGDDHLDGGNGDDHLHGQEDKDIFVLNFDYTGKDTVYEFEQGIDKIHIKKAHYDQIVKKDGSINIVEGVIKDADDNDVLVLRGFEGTLTKADFSISQQLSHESVINNIGTVDENDEGADIDGLRFTLNDNIGIDDLTLVGVFEGDKAVSDKLRIKDYADGVYGLKLKDGESFDYEQRDYIYLRLEHEGATVGGGTLLIDVNDVFEEVVEDVNDVDESLNLIEGTAGADYLYGTSGDDLIRGFDGGDYMLGGSGSDIFDVTDSHIGFDIIADFERGVDKIRINFEFEELELSGPTHVQPRSGTNDEKKEDLRIKTEDEVSGERFYVFIEDFDFDNPLTADDFEFVALEVI